MYKEIPGLVLYRDLGEDSILYKLAEIFKDKDCKLASDEEYELLRKQIFS